MGFNVKCTVSASDDDISVNVGCDDTDINVKSLDFGLTGGIGTAIAISDGMTLSAELLYTSGLLSISDDEDSPENRVFALQVGVGFPIGD